MLKFLGVDAAQSAVENKQSASDAVPELEIKVLFSIMIHTIQMNCGEVEPVPPLRRSQRKKKSDS